VKENKKDDLQCVLYCCTAPALLQAFSHLASVFSDAPLADQLIQSEQGNAQIQNGQLILARVLELEKENIATLREEVERELESRHIDVLFDIEEDSGEIEII
jgi:hypothetical protein